MANNACNCCDQPPCPAPLLEFVSVEGSCNFSCYVWDYETGKGYKTKTVVEDGWATTVYNYSIATTASNGVQVGDCVISYTCSGSITTTDTLTVFPSSTTPTEHAYNGQTIVVTTRTLNADCTDSYTSTGTSSYSGPDGSRSNTLVNGVWSDSSVNRPALDDMFVSTIFTSYWAYNAQDSTSSTRSPESSPTVTTYSNPVTSSDCVVSFPEWPSFLSDSSAGLVTGQGRSESAYKNSDTFPFYINNTLRKIKYRVRHLPTGTCYLKVWISKVFTLRTGSVSAPEISTYEWNGTGNPCLIAPANAVDAESQKINGTPTQVDPPIEDGTIAVSILKYSCVDGYEPSSMATSGFPPELAPAP